ncbi:MAG: hypothetical protein BWY75_03251 [bacterium ADurb.Bin425]|nr:MAG: hypothetical protein BWY75_03251 [bacterium ADurb.Bin425]
MEERTRIERIAHRYSSDISDDDKISAKITFRHSVSEGFYSIKLKLGNLLTFFVNKAPLAKLRYCGKTF